MREEVLVVVKEIIENEIGKSIHSFSENKTFQEIGIESIHSIKIIIKIERKYGVEFTEEEAVSILDVGSLVDFILSKKEGERA